MWLSQSAIVKRPIRVLDIYPLHGDHIIDDGLMVQFLISSNTYSRFSYAVLVAVLLFHYCPINSSIAGRYRR